MITQVRSLLVATLLCLGAVGLASPAGAEEPLDVGSTTVTDRADALGGSPDAVEAAVEAFADDTGLQLFVVYVDDFGGASPTAWARETAEASDLGTTDTLLAIAVDDGAFGVAVPSEPAIDAETYDDISAASIAPAVARGDWEAAAVDAARAYTEAADETELPWAWIVVGLVLLVAVGALVVHRIRDRYDHTHVVQDEHGHPVTLP